MAMLDYKRPELSTGHYNLTTLPNDLRACLQQPALAVVTRSGSFVADTYRKCDYYGSLLSRSPSPSHTLPLTLNLASRSIQVDFTWDPIRTITFCALSLSLFLSLYFGPVSRNLSLSRSLSLSASISLRGLASRRRSNGVPTPGAAAPRPRPRRSSTAAAVYLSYLRSQSIKHAIDRYVVEEQNIDPIAEVPEVHSRKLTAEVGTHQSDVEKVSERNKRYLGYSIVPKSRGYIMLPGASFVLGF
ncbi:hypothetical protein J6590_089102 [Homalodisca vitripennis]|nr:hypothetical protein J6590_089102 [Homalodisca vitripennis]